MGIFETLGSALRPQGVSCTPNKSNKEMFLKFHKDNPCVYERFEELAFMLVKNGVKKYSAKTIICMIRFENDIKTKSNDWFKINDRFTAYYGRLFAENNPEYKDFFNFRNLRVS